MEEIQTDRRGIDLIAWGQMMEALRQLKEDFRRLELNINKRCSDCTSSNLSRENTTRIEKLEDRTRYLESKLLIFSGAGAVALYLMERLFFK